MSFFGDFGAKYDFEKKSSQIWVIMPKKAIFFQIQLWLLWPEVADGRPIGGRKSRSIPNSHQNFLYRPNPKIDDFIQNQTPPPPFLRKNGGGESFFG